MPDTTQNPASAKAWLSRINQCKVVRRELVAEWRDNVDFYRGKPFATSSDEDRVAVPMDWPHTRARVAALFGQMPEVRLLPQHDAFAPAVPAFAKELNSKLKKADTFETVYQCLIDNSTTAVGVAMVEYQRRTEKVSVPAVDLSMFPREQAQLLIDSGQVPMEEIDRTTDQRFSVTHLVPDELLWPTNYSGFNFDKGPWIGRSGVMAWAEAKNEFKLKDSDKEKVINSGTRPPDETVASDEPERRSDVAMVEFDEIYYWAYLFDPSEKSYQRIKRIVFVTGLDEPVIHEDWKGQRFDPTSGTLVGSTKFPIRVLKTGYVTDDPIPPSESSMGRPMVLALNEVFTEQVQQRHRNKPVRLFNAARGAFDPETQTNMQKGTWQGMLPVNGPPEGLIWELPRANYPAENMQFERAINHHLDEIWQTGPNQAGAFASGERSASEARLVQANFDTRNALDRTHVARFITGIAEVMAGLLALYGEFEIAGLDGIQRMDQSWDRARINQEFVFEVIPDSMVRLDAQQQIDLNMEILNMIGKSGFVNPSGLIHDILSLAGKDPAKVMTQPNPPAAEPLNISIRNAEDLRDPLMLALLVKTGQAPGPEDVNAAKVMLQDSTMPPRPPEALPEQPAPEGPTAPPDSATAPEELAIMSKISKRSDYE